MLRKKTSPFIFSLLYIVHKMYFSKYFRRLVNKIWKKSHASCYSMWNCSLDRQKMWKWEQKPYNKYKMKIERSGWIVKFLTELLTPMLAVLLLTYISYVINIIWTYLTFMSYMPYHIWHKTKIPYVNMGFKSSVRTSTIQPAAPKLVSFY